MGGVTDSSVPAGPLAGVSVLVTRTAEQSAALAEPLVALGAEVIAFPVIEVADPIDSGPLDAALRSIGSYDWVVLTSANGVDRFVERMRRLAVPEAALDDVRVAVVGSATAQRLAEAGHEPNLVPADFRAEGLVAAFREAGVSGMRILIPRAAEAREVLPEQLAAMGATVEAVDLYRLVPAATDPAVIARLATGDIDVVTFASGATARHFLDLLAAEELDVARATGDLVIASVGPVTTAGLAALGLRVDIEAAESTMSSLVDAIAEYYQG